ncbi:DUF1045 domain-containing protein [Ferrovibrio xuzhouensis]|uniref:DUF1045 domain-containing protein n=1 Tax=Ferrovibrio xuzhouensis TaxID=1576914 RepID=A0ABV7VH66_9PROT
MSQRFALYIAPPADDSLHAFAAGWLGWDPETGESPVPAGVAGIPPAQLAALTADPRRYGLHGTLKPPFRLAEGCDDGLLIVAVEKFAATRRPLRLPPLQLAALGNFLALRPSAPAPEIDALAADCVRAFDRFRAPPSEAELARRRAAGLSARQEANLQAWGYPYVMEDFRLHFTLTGRITDPAQRDILLRHLEQETRPFTRKPFAVTELCLFVQPAADAGFRVVGRYPLAG